MRIFFILSEDRFVKPAFFEAILKERHRDTIGLALISGRNPKYSFLGYVRRHLALFGVGTLMRLSAMKLGYALLDRLGAWVRLPHFYSTEKVARHYAVPVYKPGNVNTPSFIEELRALNVDVIVSSCAQIFGRTLLVVPTKGCLNRHTALLPRYGGVWPVFWAMLHDERDIGVTIHEMTPRVDQGRIVVQGIIERDPQDSMYALYRKGMALSARLVLEALDIVEHGKPYRQITTPTSPTYFSYPSRAQARQFRRKGYRFI